MPILTKEPETNDLVEQEASRFSKFALGDPDSDIPLAIRSGPTPKSLVIKNATVNHHFMDMLLRTYPDVGDLTFKGCFLASGAFGGIKDKERLESITILTSSMSFLSLAPLSDFENLNYLEVDGDNGEEEEAICFLFLQDCLYPSSMKYLHLYGISPQLWESNIQQNFIKFVRTVTRDDTLSEAKILGCSSYKFSATDTST